MTRKGQRLVLSLWWILRGIAFEIEWHRSSPRTESSCYAPGILIITFQPTISAKTKPVLVPLSLFFISTGFVVFGEFFFFFYIPTRQITGTWEPWGCVSVWGNISRRCYYSVLADDLHTRKLSGIYSGLRRQDLIKRFFIWFKVLEERRNKSEETDKQALQSYIFTGSPLKNERIQIKCKFSSCLL